jgi:hypothetical protein
MVLPAVQHFNTPFINKSLRFKEHLEHGPTTTSPLFKTTGTKSQNCKIVIIIYHILSKVVKKLS